MAEPRILPDIPSIKSLVGEKIGHSDWLEITQERIDRFAEATEDRQWIHTDPERAKDGPFGGTIAHGHLTLSLAPFFLSQIVQVPSARMMVNPGIEKMRLRTPVRPGDRVRMHAIVKAVRDIPGGALRVTVGVSFEIEGERRPAAFGDALLVFYP